MLSLSVPLFSWGPREKSQGKHRKKLVELVWNPPKTTALGTRSFEIHTDLLVEMKVCFVLKKNFFLLWTLYEEGQKYCSNIVSCKNTVQTRRVERKSLSKNQVKSTWEMFFHGPSECTWYTNEGNDITPTQHPQRTGCSRHRSLKTSNPQKSRARRVNYHSQNFEEHLHCSRTEAETQVWTGTTVKDPAIFNLFWRNSINAASSSWKCYTNYKGFKQIIRAAEVL